MTQSTDARPPTGRERTGIPDPPTVGDGRAAIDADADADAGVRTA